MTFVPNIRDRLKGHLYIYIYIYIFFFFFLSACIKCWLVKFAGCIEKHEHTSSFPSCLIKMWTNSFFFFYNVSPESKGGLNYFFSFSPYRERVGFITLIYFTFLSSPRQQTVSSASSRGCMFHARVISDLRSAPSKVSHDIDWNEGIYPW